MENEIVKSINKWFKKQLIKNGEIIHLFDNALNLTDIRQRIPIIKQTKSIGPFHLLKLTNLDLIDAGYLVFNDETLSLFVVYVIKGKQNTFYISEPLTERTPETKNFEVLFAKNIDLQDEFNYELTDDFFRFELIEHLFFTSNRLDNKLFIAILSTIQEIQGFQKDIEEELFESMDMTIELSSEEYFNYNILKSQILLDFFLTYEFDVFNYHIPTLLRVIEAKLDTLPIDDFPEESFPEEEVEEEDIDNLPNFADFLD